MDNELTNQQTTENKSSSNAENVSSEGSASFPAPSSPFDSNDDGGGLSTRDHQMDPSADISEQTGKIVDEDFLQDYYGELEILRTNENNAQSILNSTFIDESARMFLSDYLDESYYTATDIDEMLKELDMGDSSEQDLLLEDLDWALYDLLLLNDICSTIIEIYGLIFAKELFSLFLVLAEFASKMNKIHIKNNTEKLYSKFNNARQRIQAQSVELMKAWVETNVDAGLAIIGFIAAAAGAATPGLNIILLLAGLGVGYALKRDDKPQFSVKDINGYGKMANTAWKEANSTTTYIKTLKEGEGIKDATKVFSKEAAKINGNVKGLGVVQSAKSLGGFLAALDFLMNSVDVGSEYYELIMMTKNEVESLYNYYYYEYLPNNATLLKEGEKIDLVIENLIKYYKNAGPQLSTLTGKLDGLLAEYNK